MKAKFLWTGIILVAGLAGAVILYRHFKPTPKISRIQAQDLKARGPANAPIEIVEYSDFECPACKLAQPVLAEIEMSYPRKVRLVFRHFPLPVHMRAPVAHQAAECAAQQNRFWLYHDRLYNEQEQWTTGPSPTQMLIQYAADTGLNLDIFADCLADPNVTAQIIKEKQEGQSLLIHSTPTFFINGTRFAGAKELKEQGIPHIQKELQAGS
jgi:protein-disulfide isomerase